MAAAFLVSTSAGATTSGGPITTSAINTTGASLIVVQVNIYPSSGTVSLSDSNSNTWTEINGYMAGGSYHELHTYYCASPTVGSSHTFTASGGAKLAIAVQAFSGTAASPLDQQNGSYTASGTSLQPGAITPSQNGCVIISGLAFYTGGASPSIDSSFTRSEYVSTGADVLQAACGYIVQSTASAVNPTWSWTGSNIEVVANLVSFLAASGGGFTAKQRRTLSALGTRVGSRQAQAA